MKLIPAIDIINGKCVRLTKGDYSTKKVYNEHPLEVAKAFEDNGVKHLHLVDLDGAKSRHIVNHKVLEAISSRTQLKVDFGGGLKSDADVKIAFESGAHQITGGSIAVKKPQVFKDWLSKYGSEKIILGADCRGGYIAINGWKETSNKELVKFIQDYEKDGVRYVICTDIAKDGMLQGSAIDLYRKIISKTNVKLIASGGVSSVADLEALKELDCEGAIIGKALYEGRITLKDLRKLC